MKIKFSVVGSILQQLDYKIDAKIKSGDQFIGIITACNTFVPVTIWDDPKDLPMKGDRDDIKQRELPYDPYKAWKLVYERSNDIKIGSLNTYNDKLSNYSSMLISEIYNKNIYNVVLNNVINEINNTGCSIADAISKIQQNMSTNPNTPQQTTPMSIFFDGDKIRLSKN